MTTKVMICKCHNDIGDCKCDKRDHYRISLPAAILQFYNSADHCGLFSVYDLLDFARHTTGRRLSDSSLTATLRRLRARHSINYTVVNERTGTYEFKGIENAD